MNKARRNKTNQTLTSYMFLAEMKHDISHLMPRRLLEIKLRAAHRSHRAASSQTGGSSSRCVKKKIVKSRDQKKKKAVLVSLKHTDAFPLALQQQPRRWQPLPAPHHLCECVQRRGGRGPTGGFTVTCPNLTSEQSRIRSCRLYARAEKPCGGSRHPIKTWSDLW